MTNDIKIIKKKIAEDWQNTFPQLTAYAQNKFYKIIGGVLIGIESVNIPNIEGYKPHFVIYPLWKETLKSCIDIPLIYVCIHNEKGFDFSIPYIKHINLFPEATECVKRQILPFDKNIGLKSLFEFIGSRFNDILVKSNSAEQAKLYELKFYTALYTGNQNEIQNVLKQIYNASENWDMKRFEMWYGKFDLWFQGLHEKIKNREEFLKQIEVNKQDKNIAKLKSSELIG